MHLGHLKIAVVGTGAVGGSVAADLVRAGLDVTLIDQWPAHVDAMNAQGLTVHLPTETKGDTGAGPAPVPGCGATAALRHRAHRRQEL